MWQLDHLALLDDRRPLPHHPTFPPPPLMETTAKDGLCFLLLNRLLTPFRILTRVQAHIDKVCLTQVFLSGIHSPLVAIQGNAWYPALAKVQITP